MTATIDPPGTQERHYEATTCWACKATGGWRTSRSHGGIYEYRRCRCGHSHRAILIGWTVRDDSGSRLVPRQDTNLVSKLVTIEPRD